jgi:hypothetical protein
MRFIPQMWSFFKSDSDKSGARRTFLFPLWMMARKKQPARSRQPARQEPGRQS